MKKGDSVRARFMTLPAEPYGSSDGPRHKVRVGTVAYVHPKGRCRSAWCGRHSGRRRS